MRHEGARPDGDPDVGSSESRRVVDAVAGGLENCGVPVALLQPTPEQVAEDSRYEPDESGSARGERLLNTI